MLIRERSLLPASNVSEHLYLFVLVVIQKYCVFYRVYHFLFEKLD